MKTEYDVDVRHIEQSYSKYTKLFWDFYYSNHQNMKTEYDSVDEAYKAQKVLCMIISRNSVYDVRITRRKNVLYVIKTKLEGEKKC